MSTLTSEAIYNGEIVEGIKHALVGDRKSVNWMIVAHCNGSMLSQLSRVIGSDSSVTLEIPQSDWDSRSEPLAEAIEWSAAGGAKHLLFVGHSEGCAEIESLSSVAPEGSSRILGGARKVVARARKAKEQFASHIDTISQSKELKGVVESGSLQIHALFYLAHSDTFMVYDLEAKEFRPLI